MGTSSLRFANDLNGAVDDTGRNHVEFIGGGTRYVHNASLLKRSAVVDTHIDALAVGCVGDSEHGAEGKGTVGTGHLGFVVLLAAGCCFAMELVGIVRCLPFVDLALYSCGF